MATSKQHSDPDDGLVAGECREWAAEKHETLRRYVQITSSVRRKYNSKAGAAFIDLFSGAGRALNTDSGVYQDGSPLVAWKQSVDGKAPFSSVFINDTDSESAQAAKVRLAKLGAPVIAHSLDVMSAAGRAVSELPAEGLHVAFLDPYDLGIPFIVIKKLLELQRIDMLLHVSAMDLQRNLPRAKDDPGMKRKFDAFAPGWDSAVQSGVPPASQREQFLIHWSGLIHSAGTKVSTFWELISNSKSAPLYWLVLIARHPLAHELWEKLRAGNQQPDLFL